MTAYGKIRYLDPDVGRTGRVVNKIATAGDGGWLGVATGLGILTTIVSAFTLNIGVVYFLMMIPMIICFLLWRINRKVTIEIPKDDYAVRYSHPEYLKCRGSFVEGYATPLYKSILTHAEQNHEGDKSHQKSSDYSPGVKCSVCTKRRELLNQLAPSAVHNTSDIEAATDFLKARGELT